MMRMPKTPQEILGATVRELRAGLGISQEVLAEHCDLHRTYIGGIERGERNVSLENIVRLARALKVLPGTLLERIK
ncbi:MAG TPA: helix-turn-helix transcriptional regulator [Acidobacteriaceae bacterium]